MTDAATPEAPKRITRNRPTKYPAQLAVMLEQQMYDDIVAASEYEGVAKADVARDWLRRGKRSVDRGEV